MFDLKALEGAGFKKLMTSAEWKKWHEREVAKYAEQREGAGQITKHYVLQRNGVLLTTEQNTQTSAPSGLQTTVEYPEIVVLEKEDRTRRVTCDASDTELILLLADQLEGR
jgi:hypothetical protein